MNRRATIEYEVLGPQIVDEVQRTLPVPPPFRLLPLQVTLELTTA